MLIVFIQSIRIPFTPGQIRLKCTHFIFAFALGDDWQVHLWTGQECTDTFFRSIRNWHLSEKHLCQCWWFHLWDGRRVFKRSVHDIRGIPARWVQWWRIVTTTIDVSASRTAWDEGNWELEGAMRDVAQLNWERFETHHIHIRFGNGTNSVIVWFLLSGTKSVLLIRDTV